MLKKIVFFIKEIINKILANDLYTQANAMTFSMILAVFPLLVVMIASLSFFNVDITVYADKISSALPMEIKGIFDSIIVDVFQTKHISVLSISAVIALYSASTGFVAMIRGMNRAFGKEISRGPVATRLMCIVLVLVLVALIVVSLAMLIFGDVISNLLISFGLARFIPHALHSMLILAFGIFIGVLFLVIIHKAAVDKRIPVKNIIPGAFFTIAVWLIASKVFNFYVNNFYKYSLLYGSIGTIFVLALWLNILCYVILIGSQINAVLCDKAFMEKIKSL